MRKMDTLGSLLRESFDSVVFLTGSDFENELVSNRFHWVTRFAQHLPVFFLQNGEGKRQVPSRTRFRAVKLDGMSTMIQLASCPRRITRMSAQVLLKILRRQGVEKPLFWVYDLTNYTELLILYPSAFVVLHATENDLMEQNYALPSARENAEETRPPFLSRVLSRYRTGLERAFRERIVSSLPLVDMVAAGSSRIRQDYRESGFQGRILLVQNGVDQNFWGAPLVVEPEPRVAVFQGGINVRLDFDLLLAVSELLPDWTFRFVGGETADSGWTTLKRRKNVEYLGKHPQAGLRFFVQSAAVGLIPFKQVPLLYESFPLKCLEYIAGGLPVVSTPIRDLAFLLKEKNILQFADNPRAFALAIESLASSRLANSVCQRRIELAADASWDTKFEYVVSEIHSVAETSSRKIRPSRNKLRKIRLSRTPNRGYRFAAAMLAEVWLALRGNLSSPESS